MVAAARDLAVPFVREPGEKEIYIYLFYLSSILFRTGAGFSSIPEIIQWSELIILPSIHLALVFDKLLVLGLLDETN